MTTFSLKQVTDKADFDPIINMILGTEDEQIIKIVNSTFRSPGSPGETNQNEAFEHAKSLLWTAHEALPDSRWWLLVEDETKTPVGCCQWRYYASEKPFGPHGLPFSNAEWCPEGDERDFTSSIFDQNAAVRRQWMNRPHAELAWITIQKAYRRRGLSHILMRNGIKTVDSLGLEAFLEATDIGYELYRKYGYRSLVNFHVDVEKEDPSEKWKQLQKRYLPQSYAAMWRPPHGQWTAQAMALTATWRDSFIAHPFIRGSLPDWD